MKTLPICTLSLFLLLWLTPSNNRSFLQPTPALAQSTIPDRLSNVTQVAVGLYHTCALTREGGVRCWGGNWDGQLGDDTTDEAKHTPVAVQGLNSGVTAISAGDDHTCALTTSSGVLCWGSNEYSQLGDGTEEDRKTPVAVQGLNSGVIAISAGDSHTCALTTSGGVHCWGLNIIGQLGDGTTEDRMTPTAVQGLSSGVAAISAGARHTCALTTGGNVFCWGSNFYGQLGDGTNETQHTPVVVQGLSNGVTAISSRSTHTCAVTTSDGVLCWGNNWFGQLGDGTTVNRNRPVIVQGVSPGVTAIQTGGSNTCAVLSSGTVRCWGSNRSGKLGNGTTADKNRPVTVQGLHSNVTTVSAGEWHTCALTIGSGVLCWGSNEHGQLGDGADVAQNTANPTSTIANGVATISAGGEAHTCALTDNGGVRCWGGNWFGQLGDGTTINRNLPVAVQGLSNGVAAISAGSTHTCALATNGSVFCWGGNSFGQAKKTPVAVQGLPGAVSAISAGMWYTCALTSSGGIFCWGDNEAGQLGDGTTEDRMTPTAVQGLSSGVAAISAGWSHTCALTTGGNVFCWGSNFFGQLGDGTMEAKKTPVAVQGLSSSIIAISAGMWYTCALTSSGGVLCWGYNGFGQLGDGTNEARKAPVTVQDLNSDVTAIDASARHTCAVTTNRDILCWGLNIIGQLGDGTAWSTTPVDVVAGGQTQHYLPLLFK